MSWRLAQLAGLAILGIVCPWGTSEMQTDLFSLAMTAYACLAFSALLMLLVAKWSKWQWKRRRDIVREKA